MGKIVLEFETEYNVGDVIVFEKHDRLHVGIIEGYYMDCNTFWFNIRTSSLYVYTYSNGGDIAEADIVGKVSGDLKEQCIKMIKTI